jgi:hypothetical protein
LAMLKLRIVMYIKESLKNLPLMRKLPHSSNESEV